jgi:hypothetical protein
MLGKSKSDKKSLCSCFADKLELGYAEALNSINPDDTMSEAQEKMNRVAKKLIKPCMQ